MTIKVIPTTEQTLSMREQSRDLKVFFHHIYEFKKGIRRLILTTEKDIYQPTIEERLTKEEIDYTINRVGENKINVFFGEKDCVEIVKTFNPKLNLLTPEQDFMLGIMLGYDRLKQCARYLKFTSKQRTSFDNLIG